MSLGFDGVGCDPKSSGILADFAPAANDPRLLLCCRNSFYSRYLRHDLPGSVRTPKSLMLPTIASIQVGAVISEGNPESSDPLDRQWTTGFYKMPVEGPVQLTSLGIDGDAVADTRHHGGPDKAVLCYAASHYDHWREEFPNLQMSAGAFAENLTIERADESNVCVGDIYQIGDCEVQISQPRQPCWKIARRWGIKTLTKTVAQTGRTGWYLRVLREGTLEKAQTLQLLDRPHPNWSVKRANDIMFGREIDRMSIMELMQLRFLSDAWKGDLA